MWISGFPEISTVLHGQVADLKSVAIVWVVYEACLLAVSGTFELGFRAIRTLGQNVMLSILLAGIIKLGRCRT
jgi:hypothetical protein